MNSNTCINSFYAHTPIAIKIRTVASSPNTSFCIHTLSRRPLIFSNIAAVLYC